MAKTTQVSHAVKYEPSAIAFLKVMALEVDVAMKAAGITDVKKRRKVVDAFCFGMGNFFDQYWFEAEGQRFFPMLCFSETHASSKPATAGAPNSGNFDYHDYAHGMFDALTEKGKGMYTMKIGHMSTQEPTDPANFSV